VRERYTQVAERGAAAESLGAACCVNASTLYSAEDLANVTPQAAGASAGCGNPVGIASIRPGETVLDLGSGGGIDCFLAAKATGPGGHVYGVDMTNAMAALARENAAKLGVENVTFLLGQIEAIPLPDASIDLVISNCVIALAPDKDQVFAEIFRVLRPGGRFVVSDVLTTEELPEEARHNAEEWVSCVGGADLLPRYLERIGGAGFQGVEVLSSVPFAECEVCEECGDGEEWRSALRSATVRGFRPGE
jgi:SAM-dependent methyltransferase